ncbi:glycosyltransferase family 4 protein [Paenibacillus silviterrae]|uniref:glycosyltransferase family 4 protein n=1 Tax=Paenibacillus silviterrae TaxID=3242194 RepID=UPI002543A359|nr:glycosyltransferase [Paenibacillus chinjuensis]
MFKNDAIRKDQERMKTLLIVTRYYLPVQNGLSHHTELVAELLCGVSSVHVLCEGGQTDRPADKEAHANVKVHTYPHASSMIHYVTKLCDQVKPDVVLFQYVPHMWGRAGLAPMPSLLPLWIRLRYGVPTVAFLHELYVDFGWRPKQALLALCHRLQMLLIGSASRTLIVTNARREAQLRAWRRKLVRIPAGNVSGRKPEELRRERYPYPYITWYGTLSFDQRLDCCLEAFAKLAATHRELRLLLVGGFDVNAPTMAALLAKAEAYGIRERVIPLGYMEDDELSDILSGSRANLFLAASGPSGRRGVMAAYLRSGTPIISITGHETDPEFHNHDNILLVPDYDTRALKAAIELVLANGEVGAKLTQGAKRLFGEMYSDEAIAAKLSRVLFS